MRISWERQIPENGHYWRVVRENDAMDAQGNVVAGRVLCREFAAAVSYRRGPDGLIAIDHREFPILWSGTIDGHVFVNGRAPLPADTVTPKRERLGALQAKGWAACTLAERAEWRVLCADLLLPQPPAA